MTATQTSQPDGTLHVTDSRTGRSYRGGHGRADRHQHACGPPVDEQLGLPSVPPHADVASGEGCASGPVVEGEHEPARQRREHRISDEGGIKRLDQPAQGRAVAEARQWAGGDIPGPVVRAGRQQPGTRGPRGQAGSRSPAQATHLHIAARGDIYVPVTKLARQRRDCRPLRSGDVAARQADPRDVPVPRRMQSQHAGTRVDGRFHLHLRSSICNAASRNASGRIGLAARHLRSAKARSAS